LGEITELNGAALQLAGALPAGPKSSYICTLQKMDGREFVVPEVVGHEFLCVSAASEKMLFISKDD